MWKDWTKSYNFTPITTNQEVNFLKTSPAWDVAARGLQCLPQHCFKGEDNLLPVIFEPFLMSLW